MSQAGNLLIAGFCYNNSEGKGRKNMPLALTAKIRLNPERILKSRWTHDTAHDMVIAKMTAEIKLGLLNIPAKA